MIHEFRWFLRTSMRSRATRDGIGYPKLETRWVFTPLGYGFGSIFIPMSLLMGINLYPVGLWVRFVPIVPKPVNPWVFETRPNLSHIVILFYKRTTNLLFLIPYKRTSSFGSPCNLPPHFAASLTTSPQPPSPCRLHHASITVELATGPRVLKISQPSTCHEPTRNRRRSNRGRHPRLHYFLFLSQNIRRALYAHVHRYSGIERIKCISWSLSQWWLCLI
jgi:hypothetical protein